MQHSETVFQQPSILNLRPKISLPNIFLTGQSTSTLISQQPALPLQLPVQLPPRKKSSQLICQRRQQAASLCKPPSGIVTPESREAQAVSSEPIVRSKEQINARFHSVQVRNLPETLL